MGCLSVVRKILGTPKTLCRRSVLHVHPTHLSQLPFQAPLQPRLPPRVSRGTGHGAHSSHTQHYGGAATRGFSGVQLGKGSKAGPRDRRSSSTSRSRRSKGEKRSQWAHTERLGDSEQRSSTEGLILPAAPLWTETVLPHLSTHMLLPWKMAQAAQAPPVQHAVAC